MKSILIKNGTVYDGLGNAPTNSDVLLKDGKISAIVPQNSAELEADIVVDAAGKVVCPGFIDIHRHCDAKPLNDPEFGRRELAQGITTVVTGNCGISVVPCDPDDAKARLMYDFNDAVLGPIDNNMPRSYPAFLQALEETQLPMNFAAMVGTGSIKIAVKGFADTPFTQEEKDAARALVEEAMACGAPGISVGIMYLPECYSTIDEFAYILEPVGRYGRVVTAHIRGEGDSLIPSIREMIEIARRAGCALEISHFKSCGMKNWQKDIFAAIYLIEKARSEGMDITCDFYPYEGGSNALTTMLPPTFVAGDLEATLKKLGTPEGVEEFRRLSRVLYDDWDNFCVTLGWDRIIISGVVLDKFRPMLGMSVKDAAEKFGYEDAEALAAALMHEENGRTANINMSMCQEDIEVVAKLPYSNIISDAIYADTDTPHPRMYGAFPKIIREYVGERGIFTMEEAIRKMTSMPAARMGLKGRGRIEEGAFADVLVFDPAKFRDNATFTDPARMSTGLDLCILNGEIAIADDVWYKGQATGHLLRAE